MMWASRTRKTRKGSHLISSFPGFGIQIPPLANEKNSSHRVGGPGWNKKKSRKHNLDIIVNNYIQIEYFRDRVQL